MFTLKKKRQGPDCKPTIEKAIIVTPSSLVKVNEEQFLKQVLYDV
jgi:hypothetical protein